MKFQTLNLNEDEKENAPGFWKRQFQQEPTAKQKKFDWAYGVILPIICVAADPIVFKSAFWGGAKLGEYRAFAYLLSGVSILAMTAWLLWGKRLAGAAAPLAGLFIFGSLVSLAVGILILPLTLIGLLVLIGFFGLTPLFSALVYLRNGIRAYRVSKPILGLETAFYGAALAGLFSFAIPYAMNWEIKRSLSNMRTGDVATIRWETKKLRLVWPLVDFSPIASIAGWDEIEMSRKEELVRAYETLTGDSFEAAQRRFLD